MQKNDLPKEKCSYEPEPYIHKVDLKSERITLTLMLKEQSCAFLFIIFYIRVVVSWRSRVCYPHLWIIIGPIIVFKLLILETRLKSGVKLIKVAFGECVCVWVRERERERELGYQYQRRKGEWIMS